MNSLVKKILIVSHYYPPHIGGIEIVAYNQAKYFSMAGNTVTVLSSDSGGNLNSNYDLPNVRVIRVPIWNVLEKYHIPFPLFSPSLITSLYREIKKVNVVHIHDAFYLSSFFAAIIARFLKKPVVLTQHVAMINHGSRLVVAIQKFVYATTGALVFKLSSKIITYNYRVKKFLLDHRVSESKLETLINGVDTRLFCPTTTEEKKSLRQKYALSLDKKVILFVGRYVHKKGFDKVVAVKSPDYQIAFAGGDTPKEEIENTVFLGKVNQDQLAEIYKTADLFLLPSDSEGFPLSIQEAMASALPIITVYDEGYKDYNLDASLFTLIEHPTIDSVHKAVVTTLNNSHLLEKMSAYSRQYAETNFSWTVAIERLGSIYNSVLVK